MKTVTRESHPATHNALGYLFEDNVPFTQPQQFYLRDCWDLDKLESFFATLGTEGGLDSELWTFAVEGLSGDSARSWSALDCPEDAAYAEQMLNSCFEGEDSDTWFNPDEVQPPPVQ